MSAAERWGEDEFVRLMSGEIAAEADDEEPVNLAAERQNPVISWSEFAGDFT